MYILQKCIHGSPGNWSRIAWNPRSTLWEPLDQGLYACVLIHMTVTLLQEPGWAEPLTQHNSNACHLPLVYGRKTIFCMGGLQFIVVESSDRKEMVVKRGGRGWEGVPRAGEHFQKYSRVVLPPPHVHTPSCESFSLHPGTITVWSPNTCRWSQETFSVRTVWNTLFPQRIYLTFRKKIPLFPFRNYMTERIILGMFLQRTYWIKTGHGSTYRTPWRTRFGKRLGICRKINKVMNGSFIKENM